MRKMRKKWSQDRYTNFFYGSKGDKRFENFLKKLKKRKK